MRQAVLPRLSPIVSPDGKSVVLVTEGLNTPQQISIYLPDHPEKQPLSLRPHVPREARGGAIFDNAQYLPDGKSILFMAASEGKSGFDYDIYRLELASSTLERLTYGNGFASDLCVFPDGRRAIFQKWHSDWRGTSNAAELYIIDLQSHKLMRFKVTGLN
jgi:Tol biopolymer transport system component